MSTKEAAWSTCAPDDGFEDLGARLDIFLWPDAHIRVERCSLPDRRVVTDYGSFEQLGLAMYRAVIADDAGAQFGIVTDKNIGPDHWLFERGLFLNDDIVTNSSTTRNDRFASDAAIFTDHHWSFEPDAGVDLCALADPYARLDLRQIDLDIQAAFEHVFMGLAVHGEVAYIAPVAVIHITVHGLVAQEQEREQIVAKVLLAAHDDIQEDFGLQYISACIDSVAKDLASAGLFDKALDLVIAICDDHAIIERIFHSFEDESSLGFFFAVKGQSLAQIHICQAVARDDDKGRIELVLHSLDATGSTKRLALFDCIADIATKFRTIAKIIFDGIRQIMQSKYDVLKIVLFEQIDDMLGHRLIGHGHHGLGQIASQRSQPGARTACHDYRFHLDTPFFLPATAATGSSLSWLAAFCALIILSASTTLLYTS